MQELFVATRVNTIRVAIEKRRKRVATLFLLFSIATRIVFTRVATNSSCIHFLKTK